MYGLFNGLEIGKRALLSSQLAMTTLGHNMANVNTPGYSRQRVSITSATPVDTPWGNAGSGVEIKAIEQIRDLFLTDQYRNENANLGRWEGLEKSISQIEGFFNEPQENSLGESLDRFWSAWQELANRPEDHASRVSLVQEAQSLENNFHQLDKQLRDLRQNTDNDIKNLVHTLNQYGAQIANLNLQITYQELGSEKANDLRDQRDLLIDELSQYVDVKIVERSNGQSAVLIGAMAFVDGAEFLEIGTDIKSEENTTTTKVIWASTDVEIKFSNGQMASLFQMRDQIIPEYQRAIDNLAQGIVENVNSVHRNGIDMDGVTGRDFFDPQYTDAEHISLDVAILENADHIAASLSGGPGDGSNALAVAEILSQSRVMQDGSTTIREFYGSIVGGLGIESMEATNYKDNYGLLVRQIENQRQSVQGVSLDEEMTNLVRFQNAYEAAARVITAMDQALDTLINGTGVVGR
ncbi:MAG: flagellar hook-associated protein FlgK [candidate division Zixibacteria bacterium]|nr:flagellar hook-associated protein FlgK [candidate division Zixibacteria bacterium]